MKIALIAAAIGAGLAFNVSAQQDAAANACSRAPADKKADCMKFVETCRFDAGKTMYVNRKDGKPCGATTPVNLPSEEQVRAARAKFLATHRWDDGKTAWIPLDKPRPVCVDKACTETHAEVRADLDAYFKTHTWDEGLSEYVPNAKMK